MQDIHTKIKSMKKIELHRHIEGCISPEMFYQLVLKHEPQSIYSDFSQVKKLYSYNNFRGFLDAYGVVVDFLRKYEDFQYLAKSICSQLKEDNIIYAELLFSPQPYLSKGLDLHKMLKIMFLEFAKAKVKSSLIIDFVRDFKDQEALDSLNLLLQVLENDEKLNKWVKAISIGGDELNYPAILFKNVFKKAKENNLLLYAHAGEWDDATSVWDALQELNVNRIGHGIASIKDPKLLESIKKEKIVLDISIKSNYLTGSIKADFTHPVGDLYNNGNAISLNTDDPGFFNTSLSHEYENFIQMGFIYEDLVKIRNYSIEGSFLSENEKDKLRELVNS